MRVLHPGRQGRLKVSKLVGYSHDTIRLQTSLISIAKNAGSKLLSSQLDGFAVLSRLSNTCDSTDDGGGGGGSNTDARRTNKMKGHNSSHSTDTVGSNSHSTDTAGSNTGNSHTPGTQIRY
jgi:hypothetical protein